jgi:HK97 gp10 family phage protein
MAADVTVNLDRAAIKALETDEFTVREILDAGQAFARRAAADAPKRTGAGAGSIAPWPSAERGAVDVSWSQEYPYMIFQEDGTVHVPARHFLRNAYETFVHT